MTTRPYAPFALPEAATTRHRIRSASHRNRIPTPFAEAAIARIDGIERLARIGALAPGLASHMVRESEAAAFMLVPLPSETCRGSR